MRQNSHSQKCCVLIDGSYVDRLSRSLRFDFDELAVCLRSRYHVTNIVYFCIVPSIENDFPKRRLLDWLSYNGYVVKEKVSQKTESNYATEQSDSLSLNLVLYALESCTYADGIIFISDDPDICAGISALQRNSKWVALLGDGSRSSRGVSSVLRRAADVFLPLQSIFGCHGPGQAKHFPDDRR